MWSKSIDQCQAKALFINWSINHYGEAIITFNIQLHGISTFSFQKLHAFEMCSPEQFHAREVHCFQCSYCKCIKLPETGIITGYHGRRDKTVATPWREPVMHTTHILWVSSDLCSTYFATVLIAASIFSASSTTTEPLLPTGVCVSAV